MADDRQQPLQVVEDQDTGHRFVIYAAKDGMRLELRFDGDEPWFTQAQLAEIFGVTVPTVNEHIAKLRADGELDEATIRKFRIVRQEGSRSVNREIEHYGLDVAFYVGYRVNSREGRLFRRWATDMLVQLARRGFVVDVRRLEAPQGRPDYFQELLDKVRHIRASEQRMWTRILELASFCSDYAVANAEDRRNFFATIQNAMHWATTQQTAAEVIASRVDRSAPNAGLTSFDGDLPTVAEAQVAMNFYSEQEIAALNLVTNLTLDFFESQAEQCRPTTLDAFLDKMRELLKLDGRPLIGRDHRGSVGMTAASQKAADEVAAFKERVRLERETAGERDLFAITGRVRRSRRANPESD